MAPRRFRTLLCVFASSCCGCLRRPLAARKRPAPTRGEEEEDDERDEGEVEEVEEDGEGEDDVGPSKNVLFRLHGNLPQSSRQDTIKYGERCFHPRPSSELVFVLRRLCPSTFLRKFSASKHAVLFATDVAARGLDLPVVQLIVQVSAAAAVLCYRSTLPLRAPRPSL